MVDLELLEELWPSEDRPAKLQRKKGLKGLSMSKLMKLKAEFEKEAERKGLGKAVYGRDCKPKKKKFKSMTDDAETKLHPARFECMPLVEPAKFWHLVPTNRSVVYRHMPLEHLGVEWVPESTIVRLHNRKVPVELAMFNREVTEVRHVQEGVHNYVALLWSLHPADHSALAIQKALIEVGWGAYLGQPEKQRVAIMKRFFDEVARENSGKAVRKEPPLDPEQCRARWLKTVAASVPMVVAVSVAQQAPAVQPGQNSGGKGNKKKGKPDGGRGQGAAAAVGKSGQQRPNSGQPVRIPARHNGMPVCFGYNSAAGCTRIAPGTAAKACQDGNMSYAHVCNFFVKGSGHCLADHPRHSNH